MKHGRVIPEDKFVLNVFLYHSYVPVACSRTANGKQFLRMLLVKCFKFSTHKRYSVKLEVGTEHLLNVR